jgi:hypothetical protein
MVSLNAIQHDNNLSLPIMCFHLLLLLRKQRTVEVQVSFLKRTCKGPPSSMCLKIEVLKYEPVLCGYWTCRQTPAGSLIGYISKYPMGDCLVKPPPSALTGLSPENLIPSPCSDPSIKNLKDPGSPPPQCQKQARFFE